MKYVRVTTTVQVYKDGDPGDSFSCSISEQLPVEPGFGIYETYESVNHDTHLRVDAQLHAAF